MEESLTFDNTEISIEEDQVIQASSEILVSHRNLVTLQKLENFIKFPHRTIRNLGPLAITLSSFIDELDK